MGVGAHIPSHIWHAGSSSQHPASDQWPTVAELKKKAKRRYEKALERYNQPHTVNSIIEARKALDKAERVWRQWEDLPADFGFGSLIPDGLVFP